MSRRFAGGGAWRSQGWLPWQAARCRLRAFWTSPRHLFSISWGQFCLPPSLRRTSSTGSHCLRRRTLICGQTEPVTPALNTSGHPYAQKKPPVETGSFFANPGLKTQPR